MRGRIKKALSGFYYVDTGEGIVTAARAGASVRRAFRRLSADGVEITVSGTEGMVDAIGPRRNVFSRPAVANIDQLVIVASNAIPADRSVSHRPHDRYRRAEGLRSPDLHQQIGP